MAVLLTGGAGYIGLHIAAELLALGRETVIIDDFSNSRPAAVERLERITGRKPRLYRGDAADRALLERIFSENPIDGAIHLAGFKSVGESVERPEKYYRNNLGCTLALLEAMEKAGVNRLIFSSSATVYGAPKSVPVTENSPVGSCASPYGNTKYISELMIADHARAHPGFSAVLLRYFNPVGAHPSGLIGEQPEGRPENLMPFITQTVLGKREKLFVFGSDYPTPDGTGVRDYIHISDLARGHILALDWCAGRSGAEAFNLGTGRGSSVLELVRAFERATGEAVPWELAARRPGDVPAIWAEVSKAEKILGFRAEKSLEDMCRDSWNWQKNNPEGF